MSLYQRIGGAKITGTDTYNIDCIEPEQIDYFDWQDGFGADWDEAVADAPLLHKNRILHVYTDIDFLRMLSTFPSTIDIVSYNPETEAYRRITPSATKLLTIEESDKFTNSHDGLKYVSLIYAATSFGDYYFRTVLPVVYSNTKSCTYDTIYDRFVSLICENLAGPQNYYQLLRGADINRLTFINIYNSIEHIDFQSSNSSIPVRYFQGGNLAIGILSVLYSKLPAGTALQILNNGAYLSSYISNEKLANWFYNIFLFNHYNGTYYFLPSTGATRMFKFNSALNLTPDNSGNQIQSIPNAIYLTGTITENQSNTTYAGYHGFNSTAYTLLRNFPMWTVLDGASYGCLKPMQTINARGNFLFASYNLERDYFAKFDTNGNLILDPTLSFVANLPVQTKNGATITFTDKTFRNKFTAAEQLKIKTLLNNIKNWGLAWEQ